MLKIDRRFTPQNNHGIEIQRFTPNVNLRIVQRYSTSQILNSKETFKPLEDKILYTSIHHTISVNSNNNEKENPSEEGNRYKKRKQNPEQILW